MRKGVSEVEYSLGVGPMSSEIIEAVFRCSEVNAAPLMLIASKNQIDWDGGYVNKWNTKDYAGFLLEMKRNYSKSNVLICRDHCGPNFKSANSGIFDVYKTIDCDIENNFDLIHIDFSKYASDYDGVLNESKKAIEYIKEADDKMLIEVGTDENTGTSFKDIKKIKKEINFFKNLSPIMFYVAQTGSLVKEIEQVGKFSESYARKVAKTLGGGIKIKEHNADYLCDEDIKKRAGIIGAMNIAPCLGVLQTLKTIEACNFYGINHNDFLLEAYNSMKWEKWLLKNNKDNKMLCSIIAGHYVFSGSAYKKVYDELNKHENFKETLIRAVIKYLERYLRGLNVDLTKMKILSNHPNTKENVVLEKGYVHKISKEGISEKIRAEASYYVFLLKSGSTLVKLFPKYYGYSEENGKNRIKLEYLKGYQSLSRLIFSQNISKGDSVKNSKKILALLLKFSTYKKRNVASMELFERLYIERPKERLSNLYQDAFFKNLAKIKTVSINGIIYNNLEKEFFKVIDNHRDFLLSDQSSSLFHGDLHFENILINRIGGLKVVDPKGLFAGLISYDIGKLFHSIIGRYDFIQNYHYKLTILSKNKFYFSVQVNECFNAFSKILIKELEKKIDEKLIIQSYFACWCHMISLIPHHLKNKNKQALAFYLQAVLVGDIFLNKLNKFYENH